MTAEDVASVAEQSLGRMTEADLNLGWQRLASRLAHEQRRDSAISLRPSPDASEALGRKLTLLVRKDPELAHKVARSTLQQFPQESQAELAHSIVESTAE